MDYSAKVVADTIEVRFAISGKVSSILYRSSDRVVLGQTLARLDSTRLKAELDRELAEYERVRAEFEIFAQKHPDPQDDITRYMKTSQQASLNSAVKAVEIAKSRLDDTELKSPVTGIVIEDSQIRVGQNITPGGFIYKILDLESIHLNLTISWEELSIFPAGITVGLKSSASTTLVEGVIMAFIPPQTGLPSINIKPSTSLGLFPGMSVGIVLN
jgi:multidrug resistance efflux pump